MRKRFFEFLEKKMARDDSLFLLVADMGIGWVDPIQEKYPKRFLNVGIAEQNMIGVAAGLCNLGFRPVCYTIPNFITLRCLEQIRNDICFHKYPIILVGDAAGFDRGFGGFTHHAIDDIGCLKILPDIAIYSPSAIQLIPLIFQEILKDKRPAYVRIGKSSYNLSTKPKAINSFVKRNDKSKLLVVSHGTLLENCLKAAQIGNNFSIYAINRIKPLNKLKIKRLFNKYSHVVVVEDHFYSSGLFNTLCQHLVELGVKRARLFHIGVPEAYEKRAGDRNDFANKYGHTPEKISQFVTRIIKKK